MHFPISIVLIGIIENIAQSSAYFISVMTLVIDCEWYCPSVMRVDVFIFVIFHFISCCTLKNAKCTVTSIMKIRNRSKCFIIVFILFFIIVFINETMLMLIWYFPVYESFSHFSIDSLRIATTASQNRPSITGWKKNNTSGTSIMFP